MNLSASYRYQMTDHKKSIICFYIIMFIVTASLYTFIGISITSNGGANATGNFNGIEISTSIFLLIIALTSYKETFGMMVQNGISRKTMFIGRVLTTVSVALVMAIFDKVIYLILKAITSIGIANLTVNSLYEAIYMTRSAEISSFQLHVESFLIHFFLYMALMAVGYLLTTIFYRLNKTGKVVFTSALPVGIFVVLPVIETYFTKGKITKAFVKFIDFAFGVSRQQPFHTIIFCSLILILFSGFSWIFIRRANVKG